MLLKGGFCHVCRKVSTVVSGSMVERCLLLLIGWCRQVSMVVSVSMVDGWMLL